MDDFVKVNGVLMTPEMGILIQGVGADLAGTFTSTQKNIKPHFGTLVKRISGTGAMMTYKNLGGIEGLSYIPEGGKYPEAEKYLGNDSIFKFKKFGKQYSITQEALEDTNYRSDVDGMAMLTKKAYEAIEKDTAQVFNSGFSSAATYNDAFITRPEGITRLFSLTHEVGNDTVQSNVLVDGDALSPEAVTKARDLMYALASADGEPMDYSEGLVLVVAEANRDNAKRIVNSTKVSGSNFNDINVLSDIEVFSSPRLGTKFGGSDTAWFLVAKGANGLLTIVRKEPSLDMNVDANTKNLMYTVDTRFAQGFTDYRGIVGSTGNGATYTN